MFDDIFGQTEKKCEEPRPKQSQPKVTAGHGIKVPQPLHINPNVAIPSPLSFNVARLFIGMELDADQSFKQSYVDNIAMLIYDYLLNVVGLSLGKNDRDELAEELLTLLFDCTNGSAPQSIRGIPIQNPGTSKP